MKLSDYRETYYEFSRKASDIARQLAFAGIAVVWLFKVQKQDLPRIPEDLILLVFFLVLVLALDFLQYVFGTFIWGLFQWYQERQLNDVMKDPDLSAPSYLKTPQMICFVAKLLLLVIAYILLLAYVWRKWIAL